MNLLEMNHIRKSFGDLEVLKDISLTVKKGEVVAIIRTFRFGEIHASPVCDNA